MINVDVFLDMYIIGLNMVDLQGVLLFQTPSIDFLSSTIRLMVEFLGVRVGAVEVILLLGLEETIMLVTQGMSNMQV